MERPLRRLITSAIIIGRNACTHAPFPLIFRRMGRFSFYPLVDLFNVARAPFAHGSMSCADSVPARLYRSIRLQHACIIGRNSVQTRGFFALLLLNFSTAGRSFCLFADSVQRRSHSEACHARLCSNAALAFRRSPQRINSSHSQRVPYNREKLRTKHTYLHPFR